MLNINFGGTQDLITGKIKATVLQYSDTMLLTD